MKMIELTTEQMVQRWEDQRAIKNLMGRYTYHIMLKQEKDIFTDFWAKGENDLCLGLNNGYYKGGDAVKGYFDYLAKGVEVKSKTLHTIFADHIGNLSEQEAYGVGQLEYIPLTSPLIEVAEDGKTAKGMWLSQGSCMEITAGGPDSIWKMTCYAVDFIKQGDDWKLWHMLVLDEIYSPMGQDWSGDVQWLPDSGEFADVAAVKAPEFTVSAKVWESYYPNRPLQEVPRMPEPYGTFAETFSYAI